MKISLIIFLVFLCLNIDLYEATIELQEVKMTTKYEQVNEIAKLQFVFHFHRHGARTPLKLFKEGYWDAAHEQITGVGKKQMQDLGNYIREKYIIKEKLLPADLEDADFDPSQLILFTSPKSRAIESLDYLLLGLYQKNATYEKIQLTNINEHENLKFKRKNKKLHVFVSPVKDFYFHPQKNHICPIIKEIQEELLQIEIIPKQQLNKLFETLASELNKTWGTQYQPKKMKIKDASQILDLLTSGQLHDIKEIPQFETRIMHELQYIKRVYVYKQLYGTDEIVRKCSTQTYKALLHFIRQNQQSSKPKMAIFSGHDRILAPLLKAILDPILAHYAMPLNTHLDIPYASFMTFELYSFGEKSYVQLSFNKKTLSIKNCNNKNFVDKNNNQFDKLCELSEFEKILESIFVEDLENSCKIQNHKKSAKSEKKASKEKPKQDL